MRARLAVLPLVAAALAVPAAQGAQTAQRAKERVIRVMSVELKLVVNDTKPKNAANKGDSITFHDRLLNPAPQFGMAKGVRVGSDRGTLTYTGPRSARFDGIATLPGGTLILRGQVYSRREGGMAIPVAGGTGKFKGARGVLLVDASSPKTPKRALNTYRLIFPPPVA